MTEIYSNSAYDFFLKERQKSKFLMNEILIILLITSVVLWVIFKFNDFSWLFTGISIQLILTLISFKLFNNERDRKNEATQMLSFIESDIHETRKSQREEIHYFLERFFKERPQYKEESYLTRQIELILRVIQNPDLSDNIKSDLIMALIYMIDKNKR